MSLRRRGRFLYGFAFIVLLADGAGAIWLGEAGGRWALVVFGACLVLGALGVLALYRRWRRALEQVDRARQALKNEVEALRRAVQSAPPGSSGRGAKRN